MMQTMRKLLSQEPMTFNELLDLFEAYIATIGEPIRKGTDMIREEVGMGENVALGHIFGVACDAEDMAERLKRIRAARNTGTDVTITMARGDAVRVEKAADEAQSLLSEAAAVFGLLHMGIVGGYLSGDDPGAMSVMSLAQRALVDAEDREGGTLARLAHKLREAGKYQPIDQEDAA